MGNSPADYRKEMNSPWDAKFAHVLMPAMKEVVNDWAGKPLKETSGRKDDNGKSRIDLVDAEFLEGLGNVLAFGANKYAAHNWRGGIAYSRLIAAAYRHIGAINKGEDIDPESGQPHIYHAACCLHFLSWMMKHRPDLDDRYKNDAK
jgi:hypothetical protein